MDSRPVAIVVPTHAEFAPYRELLPDLRRLADTGPWETYVASPAGRDIVLIVCGAGPVNVAAAGERLLAQFAPAAILHGGSAGAHDPALLPGDIVVGRRYLIVNTPADREARVARGLHPSLIRFYREGASVSLDYIEADPVLLAAGERLGREYRAAFGHWEAGGWPAETPRRAARVAAGVVATADVWTVEPGELARLHAEHSAACEDMESAYLAQICALHGIPFVAVRVISNNEAVCPLAPSDVAGALRAAGERAARILLALAAELPTETPRAASLGAPAATEQGEGARSPAAPASGLLALFGGPAGAGKSTLAAAWCAARPRAVHVQLDEVRERIRGGRADPRQPGALAAEQYALSVQACIAQARPFLSAGYDVAIDDVLEPAAFAAHWQPLLIGLDWRLVVIYPSLQETLTRAAARDKQVPAVLTRDQHAATGGWPERLRVDTTGLEPRESLARVRAVLDG